ncbi:hypothetical protein [Dyadobacter aurulentus]|uniref:hypothetical protein n=1 Tax=Dyadobacter sp. UC 10 TaxID=2605428 RepID=UPI0011F1481B|nr:hypothetical protein [Dyadobacter sp. UC 10]KAA0992813.1 hypothetical protein FXO21_22865 [Dyadobacter sp. UC 10]
MISSNLSAKEKVRVDDVLKRADQLIQEGKDSIVSEGKVLELTAWLTISEYAEKYNVSTQVVSKWIERGVIKQNYFVEVSKFGKKLVRDVAYKD